MFKKIVLGLLAVILLAVGVFAAVVAMQPADFRIERSETMAAPPAEVFAQVNDFHNWQEWSPWAKLDPKATNTFEGSSSGEGAIFTWSGNDEVGQGDMTITESHPNELIKIKLHFVKPMEGTNVTEFTFKPVGDKTLVTWAMSGENNSFVGKAMCLVMNMQKMVGDQFSQGLATMKGIVEAPKTKTITTEEKTTEAKTAE